MYNLGDGCTHTNALRKLAKFEMYHIIFIIKWSSRNTSFNPCQKQTLRKASEACHNWQKYLLVLLFFHETKKQAKNKYASWN